MTVFLTVGRATTAKLGDFQYSVNGDGYLKLEELRHAERMVVHWVQTEVYSVEFECLQNDNNNTGRRVKVKTTSSLVNQLGLYIDYQVENYPILRCRSRLEHANLVWMQKTLFFFLGNIILLSY